MSEGFTDLRLNRQEGSQESFWPSFTDIMTTVVMIFLIALVVLLVRNIELVNQLRSTMEAERIAAELARATGEEKDSLSVALHNAEEQIQQLRLEIMRLQDKGIERESLITEQLSAIADLTNQRDDLTQQAAQLMLIRKRLEADVENRKAQLRTAASELQSRELELSSARTDIDNLKSNLVSLQGNLDASQQLSSELSRKLAEKQKELEANRREARDMERKYLVLVGDYDSLKGKYDKLVRPARSTTGRDLVEVRYWKADGEFQIAWREGNQGEFQNISRKRLDLVLTRLSRERENGLYVKVIFPENAGLSYNEAWEFTSHLHRNYDYYFREENARQ